MSPAESFRTSDISAYRYGRRCAGVAGLATNRLRTLYPSYPLATWNHAHLMALYARHGHSCCIAYGPCHSLQSRYNHRFCYAAGATSDLCATTRTNLSAGFSPHWSCKKVKNGSYRRYRSAYSASGPFFVSYSGSGSAYSRSYRSQFGSSPRTRC